MPENLDFKQENSKELPSTLNVLTILTFIGSALELYSGIKNFVSGREGIDKIIEAQNKMAEAPVWTRKLVGPEVLQMAQIGYEYRMPILFMTLISIALCVYGALEMRKLKLQGYYLYLAGEILPIVSLLIIMGSLVFHTMYSLSWIFPAVFIILYTTQKKLLS